MLSPFPVCVSGMPTVGIGGMIKSAYAAWLKVKVSPRPTARIRFHCSIVDRSPVLVLISVTSAFAFYRWGKEGACALLRSLTPIIPQNQTGNYDNFLKLLGADWSPVSCSADLGHTRQQSSEKNRERHFPSQSFINWVARYPPGVCYEPLLFSQIPCICSRPRRLAGAALLALTVFLAGNAAASQTAQEHPPAVAASADGNWGLSFQGGPDPDRQRHCGLPVTIPRPLQKTPGKGDLSDL